MTIIDSRTWLEHLAERDCWALLEASSVGRVAVLVDSAPEIYPVNHVVDDGTILFRTDAGSKLRGIGRSPSVSFEVDAVDVKERSGWSVLVKGRAIEVTDSDELRHAATLPLLLWALGEKSHWIRIVPDEVTGRRIHPRRRPS